MRRFVRENGLSLFFLAIFLATLAAQSLAGLRKFNEEQLEHDGSPISWLRYVSSSDFGTAVMENWQSEFLQFSLFIYATVYLVQRGSNESKEPERIGRESHEQQRLLEHAEARSPAWAKVDGLRRRIYSHSLMIVMTLIFFACWGVQSLTGWRQYNEEQLDHEQPTVAWSGYVQQPDFWERTLQNWQSEFLAVGVMAVFTIYLRERGSPESKPVGAPHDETASSG
jgi:hypothetical protein